MPEMQSRREWKWNISRQIEYYGIRRDQMLSGIIYRLRNWFMLMTVKILRYEDKLQIVQIIIRSDIKHVRQLVYVGCRMNDQ